jgi:hypothetical protein
MKKRNTRPGEMRPEYDFANMKGGVRGKYAKLNPAEPVGNPENSRKSRLENPKNPGGGLKYDLRAARKSI